MGRLKAVMSRKEFWLGSLVGLGVHAGLDIFGPDGATDVLRIVLLVVLVVVVIGAWMQKRRRDRRTPPAEVGDA